MLQLAIEWPQEDSVALAERASARAGRQIQPEAFRKQLSRARQRFAELLVQSVAETLADPTPKQVDEELAALGLLTWVSHYRTADES